MIAMLSKLETANQTISVNGRDYRWPMRPTIVVCFDGCDPAYIDAALAAGCAPTLAKMISQGFAVEALAAMPTFTNPNNISIVCGAPPSVHGVSGNYYLDRQTGQEVMMLDAAPMRAETILARFAQAGADVIAITAKDKLRKALALNLRGIAFSAEDAASCTQAEHGISGVLELLGRETPDQYSADLSLFVLDAGIRLIERRQPQLVYLSLSDYVQHKYAPTSAAALEFMSAVDSRLAALLRLNAVVGIVADHGMSDMADASGQPNVIYVGDKLDAEFGTGSARVICPITDPFVRHHGALGGFVRVHLGKHAPDLAVILRFLAGLEGVELVLEREEACERFQLPFDSEADIVVVGSRGVALGARSVDHDISQLAGERLRSHGGLAEQSVPFILSEPLNDDYAALAVANRLHNFDIFDFVLNGIEA